MDVIVFTLNLVVTYLVMDGGAAQSFSSVLLALWDYCKILCLVKKSKDTG